ncbi:MAG: hypothetical protein KAI07_05250, partial [Deltaproteobacteria bacterium]|nr:hypothetical protein [Deltaproteobacteria bacterium]
FSPLLALGISWLITPLIIRLSSRLHRYCLCLEVKEPVTLRANIGESAVTLSQVVTLSETKVIASQKENCEQSLDSSHKFEVLDILHWLSAARGRSAWSSSPDFNFIYDCSNCHGSW